MNLTQFISEIESSFPTYARDLDKVSIKYDVLQQLRIFGLNIAEMHEKVLKVRNSKAILPNNFKSLKLALKLQAVGCNIQGDIEDFTKSYIYKERIENGRWFDEVNQQYVDTGCATIIRESINYPQGKADLFYDFTWLSVVKGIKKDVVSGDCLNLHPSIRNAYPHEINITGNTLNTNFTEGEIYIQYYGLPTDETGEIVIPEYTTSDILTYITQYVKVNIAERLIQNNLNPQGIVQLYPNWKSELTMLKRAALSEAKFAGLDKNWNKKFKKLNREYMSSFNLPNLNF